MEAEEAGDGKTRLLDRVHQFALDPFVEFLDPGNVLLFLGRLCTTRLNDISQRFVP